MLFFIKTGSTIAYIFINFLEYSYWNWFNSTWHSNKWKALQKLTTQTINVELVSH